MAALAILATAGLNAVVSLVNGHGASTFATWWDPYADVSEGEAQLLMVLFLSSLAMLSVYILAIVLFCVWLHRVARNARALGVRNLDNTPGWAVGYFFIPIMNLFVPYKAVKEIWQSSDPDAEPDFWSHRPAGLVGSWWAFFLIGNIGGRVIDRFLEGAYSASFIMPLATLQAALPIIAAVLATRVIRGIAQRQTLKAERMAATSGVEPLTC